MIKMKVWKDPLLLLTGIGISNFGAWVYLIALNLIVLEMTHSPFAVAGLYIIKPVAALLTNGWAGSVVDRTDKRTLMVILDVLRAALLLILPFSSTLWGIYLLVLAINMAGAMFEPASMAYIAKLIPREGRQQFNAFRSLIDSGAFLIGPAIAGILFMVGTPVAAIYINAIALFLSGLVKMGLPQLEESELAGKSGLPMSRAMIKKDWNEVMTFSRISPGIMIIFFLFSCFMVMATAIDSQEASFAKAVLLLADSEYGFLVSIAGAGIIAGAGVNAAFAKSLPPSFLIGGGAFFVSAGYLFYAFSSTFTAAAIGFFMLAFALAFANTGFQTFSQNNIPVEMMGRIVSLYSLLEAGLIIIAAITIGAAAHMISIRFSVIAATSVMLFLSILLWIASMAYKQNEETFCGQIERGS
ncbi:MFS transporter [Planomicrobium sp. CPCC 101110]|uniref:MFS transporter n=1 Tax=Planomicrobium sp. CPCC 101110 TaxID=2599619 RepID=UPI0011B6CBC4|nr:MFS transporter [Planomicrobium sp. CPCC 101110]TWT25979.1 MFS transporter [Planomicrobium sp. CPCC 101110]